MSGDTSGQSDYRVDRAHQRLDEHADALEHHDRRISINENWRLQAQGALKVIALMLGGGVLAVIIDMVLGIF